MYVCTLMSVCHFRKYSTETIDISDTFVGVELVEGIKDGHNGTVNGIRYFQARPGHGILVRISNIIQKLNAAQLTYKMQEMIVLCAERFAEYIEAVQERNDLINEFRKEIYRLRELVKESTTNSTNDALLPNTRINLYKYTEIICFGYLLIYCRFIQRSQHRINGGINL